MERRELLGVIKASVIGWSLIAFGPATAEEQSRPLVAVLSPRATETYIGALRAGLAELGYVEGRNISFVLRSADGDNDRLSPLAAELVALKPAVIVTNGGPAIRAVKQLAGTTPIVMAVVDDVVALGFAQSLAHPGGNYRFVDPREGGFGQAPRNAA